MQIIIIMVIYLFIKHIRWLNDSKHNNGTGQRGTRSMLIVDQHKWSVDKHLQ